MELEPLQLYWIAGIFSFCCLISRRPSVAVEEEFEDSEEDEELEDKTLLELQAYHLIAREVSVKRANGDVYEVKFRHDDMAKVVHNVASGTPEPSTRLVWSEDGRMLQRETLNWGGEQ